MQRIELPAGPGPLDNPLKGWAAYSEPDDTHSLPTTMAYFYTSWRELEPKKGKFAFDAWEKHWDNPTAAGKHVVLRLYLDYPGKPSGIPQWLLDSGLKTRRYEKLAPDIPGGFCPDYDDPKLLRPLLEFITAFGDHYNRNPRVAFVAVGTLGFWGEWHTWPKDEWFASRAVQQKVLDAYHKWFPDKILVARYPANRATADANWIGYHDDLFPEDTDGTEAWKFLPMLRRGKRTENWKHAVLGGEMVPGQAKKWLGEGWAQTKAMAEAMHLSWVGPYCPSNEPMLTPEQRANAQALVRRMGYQFKLTRLIRTGAILRVEGINEGVAPFYYKWPVELVHLDGAGRALQSFPVAVDIRSWQPGPFAFEVRVPQSGSLRLALGIRDPWTGRPAIRFANALPVVNGWTILTE